MKKYILSAIAVVGALAMTSCSDFLQPMPEGNPTTESYFTNDQQAIDAVDAFLRPMTSSDPWYGREYQWVMYETNMGVVGKTKGWVSVLSHNYAGNSTKEPIQEPFLCATDYAAKANFVIWKLKEKAQKTELTYIEKRSLGEAIFWRGLYHWVLAFRHGTNEQGVPFINYEDEDNPTAMIPTQQATVMEDYAMVIKDLEEAATLLPTIDEYSSEEKGRASADAAIGLQAKVYAYWAAWDESQWKNVIAVVDKLEKAPYNRALIANYDDNFTYDNSKWANSEEILAIYNHGQSSNAGGTEWPGVMFENKGYGQLNGWGQGKPTLDLFESFVADDDKLIDESKGNIRKHKTILEYGDEWTYFGQKQRFFSTSDLETGFMVNKYLSGLALGSDMSSCQEAGGVYTNPNWPIITCTVPILRFADCLLLRAEAKIMTGQDGSADINKVRNRANVKSLDHTATMADIYHERRVELAFEICDPQQDLRRWTISSNAEIKALALKELTTKPRVRHYADRSNPGQEVAGVFIPNTDFTIATYTDSEYERTWSSEKIVYPYPSTQVAKANGALKQNKGFESSDSGK